MSLPSKQEVLQEARTKGFAERVKFGALLGHKHAKSEGLSALLQDVRSYEAPVPPQLDAASVEIAKVLPVQQKSGAKSFDVEQVALAAANAAGDRAALESEIRGPSASHLEFASLRLTKMVPKDEAGTTYLLSLLISLADKRRKAFLKGLIKNRHTAVLDRYAVHLEDAKDIYAQLRGFLHGCSHALVVKYFAELVKSESQTLFLHFARYHPLALLEVFEAQLKAAKGIETRTNDVWATWRGYTMRHGRNGAQIWMSSRAASARLLVLATQYPPLFRYDEKYFPTMPDLIRYQWALFTKFHADELFAFAMICVYPFYNYQVFTFSLDMVRDRVQLFRFLEVAIPKTENKILTDISSLSLPSIFSTAVGIFARMSYLPDVLEHMKKLVDWSKRYAAKFPALQKYHYWLSEQIFQGAAVAVDRIRGERLDGVVEPKHKLAKERLIEEGKSYKEMTPAMLGCKQVDNLACDKAQEAVYAQFIGDFESDVKAMHKTKGDKIDYRVRRDLDGLFTFSQSIVGGYFYSIPNVSLVLNIYDKYAWTIDEFAKRWAAHKRDLMEHIWTIVTQGQHSQNDLLYYTPAQITRFTTVSKEAWKIFYDVVAKNPNSDDSRGYIAHVLESAKELPWTLIEPFWKFLTVDHFIEMAKDGKEQEIITNFFAYAPLAALQPILAALFAPKVLTPAQRTRLMPSLDVADSKNRQNFEKGTSSPSAPERIAALLRMTHATVHFPFVSGNDASYGAYLQDKEATASSLKESTLTLAFIIKRIKNATFQDRVIYQRLAFEREQFGTHWLAPGVGPTQFALWYEMLDDHLQNPNHSLTSITIDDESSYESALEEEYDFSPYQCNQPLYLWNMVIERALSLALSRNDDALLDFAFEIAAKIGTVESGAADPLGTRIQYRAVAGRLLSLRDTKLADEIVAKFALRVQKYCNVPELKPLKVLQLYRALITAIPIVHLQFVPVLYQHLVSLLNDELASFKECHISDVLKPPTLPTGFEEEAEKEQLAQRSVLSSLCLEHVKRVHRVPVLVDFVFKVALRSWAAKTFIPVAWSIRLRTAFAAHRKAFNGPSNLYNRLKGAALRKFEMDVASKFARELVDICPSALHLPRVQRIFSYIDPSVLFKHIPTETADLDYITDETEKLTRMQQAGLLGPFMFPNATGPVAMPMSAPRPSRGGRGRGARRGGRGRVVERMAPVFSVVSSPSNTIQSLSTSQMALVRDVIKKWRRGQSTKSSDNTNFFIPTLCYDMMNRHAAQVLSLGNSIYQAILNPMRALATQKKLVILWTLLPTTNYADIVIFLQQNDFNFQPSTEEEAEPAMEDEKVEGEESSSAKPAIAVALASDAAPKAQLPLAVVETAIRGTTMNDEPLAPLPFLLSPTFLSSSYSRIAVQAVQSLMPYVPGGLLTKALAYLLKDHRATLKTTAHKQIIRFLAEHASVEHWDIFVAEWEHPKTHRDVRITILTAAFNALTVATGDVLERVWRVLEMATTHREADVVCSLLKVQPARGPRRAVSVYADLSAMLLNNRTKNQYNSFTTSLIPSECAPRYLEKIVKPILAIEGGINGSDLQFLAFSSIHQWSAYLSDTKAGDADYAKAAELVSLYLVKSLESTALWQSDKKKELMATVTRWGHMAEIFAQLLTYSKTSSKRSSFVSSSSYQPADYIIEGGAALMADLVTKLVSHAESLLQPMPTPSDVLRYRQFTNAIEALRYLMDNVYSLSTVAYGNATLAEQDSWLAPLRASSFAVLLEESLTTVQLHQWDPKVEHVEGFLAAYHVFVEKAAANPSNRSSYLNLLATWLNSVPTLYGGLEVLKRLLVGLELRLTKWASPTMQSLDISYCLDLATRSIQVSIPNVALLMDTYIDFLELVLKANAEVVAHVQGFEMPNIVSHVQQSLALFASPSYTNISSSRKRFMEWLVSRALTVEADYVTLEHPTRSQTQYVKLWRQVLRGMRGSYLAQYVPSKVRAVLDAAASEGDIETLTTEIISTWLDPSLAIADPALEGHGHPGVDYEFAMNLIADLARVNLNPARTAEQKANLSPRYVLHCLDAALKVMHGGNTPHAPILLFRHKPDIWWTLFNTAFVLEQTMPNYLEYRLGTPFLNTAVDSAVRVSEEAVHLPPLLTLIRDLHECKGALHSLPEVVRNLWPFAPVMQAYRTRSQSLAVSMLVEHGQGLALTPPKEKGSTKKTWRPLLLELAEELLPAVPLEVSFPFASSTLFSNTVLYEWPKPAEKPEPAQK